MKLFKGFMITSSGNVLKILAALVARTLMARLLGPVFYGGLGVGMNMATVMSRLLNFGVMPAAQYFGSKSEFDRRDHLRTSLVMGAIVGLSVTAVGVLLVPHFLAGYWTKQPIGLEVFQQLAPFLGLVILGNILGIILIPWNRVLQYTLGQVLVGLLVPLVFLATLPFVLPLKAAVLAQITVWIVALAYNLVVMRGELFGGRFQPDLAVKMVKYGLQTWPHVILNVGAARLAILLGANYLGQNDVGLFIVGMNISEAIFGFHGSLGQLVLSRVSEEESRAYQVTQQTMRLSVILLIAIALLYILLGQPLLVLIFGREYSSSWNLSLVLLITGGAHSLGRLSANVLAGLGKPIRNTVTLVGEVLSLAILVPLLTMSSGTIGLALASAISAVISLIISLWQTGRLMGCGMKTLLVPEKNDAVLIRVLLKSLGTAVKSSLKIGR
jgi:O-antigen/teichoic acid export membrane protein